MRQLTLLLALLVGALPGTARAGFDTETGWVVADEPGLTIDLDGPESFGQLPVHFLDLYNQSPNLGDVAPRFESVRSIEGLGAFRFGGDLAWMVIELDGLADTFAGRRVEVSLWLRPEGTSIRGGVAWRLGSLWDSWMGQGYAQPLGDVSLRFTGEVTSDGWERWSTGPVDFSLGGVVPLGALYVRDRQNGDAGTYLDWGTDQFVRLDALQIRDLGPAAVAPAACTLANEAQACGAEGACLFGRCVDAAAVVGGAIPEPELRRQFLDRRAFELRTFDGSRATHARMDDLDATFADIAQTDGALPFWSGLHAAVADLRDGHASPPMEQSAQAFPVGICLGPGVADLVDGAAAPLVFGTNATHPVGAQVKTGDVLVAVDGEPVATFRERAARHLYFAGDPGARDAATTSSLIPAAVLAGATLTFERCPGLDAVGGCAGPIETIDVDLADAVSPLWTGAWNGGGPDWSGVSCDGRFRMVDGVLGSTRSDWASTRLVDGVQVLMFNGFPSHSQSPSWITTLSYALQDAPSRILVDERLGHGGTVTALQSLVGYFIESPTAPLVELFPLTDFEVDYGRLESLRACYATATGELPCGWFDEWQFGEGHSYQGVVAESRVALLVTDDVSANDFFTRMVLDRPGETRIFGPGPTRGAFGPVIGLASLLGEAYGGSFQVQDSLFMTNPVGDLPAWATGTGVPPDEVVRQTQSDALRGVDTILEAATTWVQQ